MTKFLLVRIHPDQSLAAVASAVSEEMKLPMLAAHLTSINVMYGGPSPSSKVVMGTLHCTHGGTDTYTVFQRLPYPDWEGDPVNGWYVKDLYSLVWMDVSKFLRGEEWEELEEKDPA